MVSRLPASFYQRADVVSIARELLGKELVTCDTQGRLTAGIITETEAYDGPSDRACHSYNYRRTPRTETMYQPGGVAYVYLCYGVYELFNVVTHEAEQPYAVLIRGLEPTVGIDLMLARRKLKKLARNLTSGPGLLTQALAISRAHNGADLNGKTVWIAEEGRTVKKSEIISSARIGVESSGEPFASLPYRFRIKDNPWTSPAK